MPLRNVMNNSFSGVRGSCLAVLTSAFLFLAACKDPCKSVECKNGGSCEEGHCDCAAGWGGEACALDLAGHFSGPFAVDEDCSISGVSAYEAETHGHGNGTGRLDIHNFGDLGLEVIARLEDDRITIERQEKDGMTFEGSGSLDTANRSFQLHYTVHTGSVTQTCTAGFSMKP